MYYVKVLCAITLGIVITVSFLAMTVLKPLGISKSLTIYVDKSLEPQLKLWVSEFSKSDDVVIKYYVINSSTPPTELLKYSDALLTNEPCNEGIEVPVSLSALVIVYNIPQLPNNYHLRLNPEVMASIFKGDIKYWDDPRIKSLNPEVANELPHEEIIVNYLGSDSWVNEVLNTYLSTLAPSKWGYVGRELKAVGNQYSRLDELAKAVKEIKYSISYIPLNEAMKYGLQVASIMNKAGNYVAPKPSTLKESVKGLNLSKFTNLREEVISIIKAGSKYGYPMTYAQYLIINQEALKIPKKNTTEELINWVVSNGRNHLLEGYAPIESK